jgi:hypothetical protein
MIGIDSALEKIINRDVICLCPRSTRLKEMQNEVDQTEKEVMGGNPNYGFLKKGKVHA